jgi:hypothetical protein
MHVPATLFVTCRKTQVGAVVEINECPMTPETAHAPAKSAAPAMPGTSAASVNPTSAKRSFVADIMTFLFATTFAKETRLASFRHRRNPPPFGVRKVDKLLEVHGVHDEPGVKSVEVAEALAIELDIEGSALRWERDRAAMQDAVRRHDTRHTMLAGRGRRCRPQR